MTAVCSTESMDAKAGRESCDKPQHLVVLHHGLWGFPEHIHAISRDLLLNAPHETGEPPLLDILDILANPGDKTFEGIDVCGERAVQAVLDYTRLKPHLRFVSFIGYSLGGLVLRFVVGRLYALGFFATHTPMNYTSFASPHLGLSLHSRVSRFVSAAFLSRTGLQLALKDDFLDGRPLLECMADPSLVFHRALATFQRLALFANCKGDLSVDYKTAHISLQNPFYQHESV
ncbi:hypothetical protein HDU91_000189, partial [Kappamyces sp. JEL0680]